MVRADDVPAGSAVRARATHFEQCHSESDERLCRYGIASAVEARAGVNSDGRASAVEMCLGGDGGSAWLPFAAVEVHVGSAAAVRGRNAVPAAWRDLVAELRSIPSPETRALALEVASRTEMTCREEHREATRGKSPYSTPEAKSEAIQRLSPAIGAQLVAELSRIGEFVEARHADIDAGASDNTLYDPGMIIMMRRVLPFAMGMLGKFVGVYAPTASVEAMHAKPLSPTESLKMQKALTLAGCMMRVGNQKAMPRQALHGAMVLTGECVGPRAMATISANLGYCCSTKTLDDHLGGEKFKAAAKAAERGSAHAMDNSQFTLSRTKTQGQSKAVINFAGSSFPMLAQPTRFWWLGRDSGFVDPKVLAADVTADTYRVSNELHVGQYHNPDAMYGPADAAAAPVVRRGAEHFTESGYLMLQRGMGWAYLLKTLVFHNKSGERGIVVPMSRQAREKVEWMASQRGRLFLKSDAHADLVKQVNPLYAESRRPVWHDVNHTMSPHNAGTSKGTADHLGEFFRSREAVAHVTPALDPHALYFRMLELASVVAGNPGRYVSPPACNNPLLPADADGMVMQEYEATMSFFVNDGAGLRTSASEPPPSPPVWSVTMAYEQVNRARNDHCLSPSPASALAVIGAIEAVDAARAGVPATQTEAVLPQDSRAGTGGRCWTPPRTVGATHRGERGPGSFTPSKAVLERLFPAPVDSSVTMDMKLLAMAGKTRATCSEASTAANPATQAAGLRYVQGYNEIQFLPGELHLEGAILDALCRAYAPYLLSAGVAATNRRKSDLSDVMNNLRTVRSVFNQHWTAVGMLYTADVLGRSDCPALDVMFDADGHLRLSVWAPYFDRCIAKDAQGVGPDDDAGGTSGDGSVKPPGYLRDVNPLTLYRLKRCVGVCKADDGSPCGFRPTTGPVGGKGMLYRMRYDGYSSDADRLYLMGQLVDAGTFKDNADAKQWLTRSLAERSPAQVAADAVLPAPHIEGGASVLIPTAADDVVVPGRWIVGGTSKSRGKSAWTCGGCVAKEYVCMTSALKHCHRYHADDPVKLAAMCAHIEAGPPAIEQPPPVAGELDEAVANPSFAFYGKQLLVYGALCRGSEQAQLHGDCTMRNLRPKWSMPLFAATGKRNYLFVAAKMIEQWSYEMPDLMRLELCIRAYPVLNGLHGSTNDDVVEIASKNFKKMKSQSSNQLVKKAPTVGRMQLNVDLARSMAGKKAYYRQGKNSNWDETIQRLVSMVSVSGVLCGNSDAQLSPDTMELMVKASARQMLLACMVGGTVEKLGAPLDGSIGTVVRIEAVGGTVVAEVEYDVPGVAGGAGHATTVETGIDTSSWNVDLAAAETAALWAKLGKAASAEDDELGQEETVVVGMETLVAGPDSAAAPPPPQAIGASHGHLQLSAMRKVSGGTATAVIESLPDGYRDLVSQMATGAMPAVPRSGSSETAAEVDRTGSVLTAGLAAAMQVLAGMRPERLQSVKAASKAVRPRPPAQVHDLAEHGWALTINGGYPKMRAAAHAALYAKYEAQVAIVAGSDASGTYHPEPNPGSVAIDTAGWDVAKDAETVAALGNLHAVEAAIDAYNGTGWRGVSAEDRSNLMAAMLALAEQLETTISEVIGPTAQDA